MNSLIFTLRAKSVFMNNSLYSATALATRGPKKKKGPAKSDAPESSDIVNIFKDRPDPIIYATERYPPWLKSICEETYSPDDVTMQIYRGERMPTGSEQWTLYNSFRRQFMKDQNYFMKQEVEYESEDDEGEDIGEGEGYDEEEQQEGGEGGAEGGAAKAEGGEKKEGGEDKKEGGDKKEAGDKKEK